jgi:hypothetical protein
MGKKELFGMKNREEHSQNDNPVFGEVLTVDELAERWKVPPSWIREQTRSRACDVLPHIRLGKYVRFAWNSPELVSWWKRRQSNGRKSLASNSSVS